MEGAFRIFFYTALCSGNDSWVAVAPPLVAESYSSGGDTFYTWIYHPDLLDYTDPYGGINECGCFGEAFHLSNGATLAKNILLLAVAGIHLWNVFRQKKNPFHYRLVGLTVGVLVVALGVPLYAYLYLPPFDFYPILWEGKSELSIQSLFMMPGLMMLQENIYRR